MSFATAKELQASRKFELVRMNPARYIVDDLVSAGGGIYTYNTNYFVSSVQENGTALIKVSSASPGTGEYYFDESNSLLYVHPNNTPSSTNPIVMFHFLFFTGEIYRTWHENPDDSLTKLRDWQPLLKSSPNINQSIEDLLAGTLSISSSVVEIINNDYDLNQYFTINDSFYNKEINIWLCLEDESNMQKIFEGRICSAIIMRDTVMFDIRDNLSMLSNPALMGDESSEAYFSLDDNPSLDPLKTGTPCFYIVGTCSRYQTINESVTNLPTAQKLDYSTLYYATCTNYSSTISVSNNRQWTICRTSSEGFQNIGLTTLAVDNTDPNFTKFTCSPSDIYKLYIGDTFVINQGIDRYARVLYVDRVNNYIYTTPISVTGTPTVLSNSCPSIVVNQGNAYYYLLYGRDYIATVTTTSGGNKMVTITLVNDFETTLGMTPLDPTIDAVLFRVRPAKLLHGELVQKIIEVAGLNINSASIASANSFLPVNVSISMPLFDEVDYGEYYSYLQHILGSVFGYVFLNNSFEIEYKLFVDPVSTNEITDTEVLKNSYRAEIEYQDIVTQVIAYNPHANSVDFVAKTGTSLRSKKAECLHGFVVTTRFQHCLEDITSRLGQILQYRSNRVAKYKVDTATKNLDSQLGEDFKLNKTGLLGESTKQVKLISIDKKSNESNLILTDLGV